jgi:hypothetical protein
VSKRRTSSSIRVSDRRRRAKPPQTKPPQESSKPETTQRWRKTAVWTSGVGTVVIAGVLTGVLVNVLTPSVQRLTAPVGPDVAATTPTSAPRVTSASKPRSESTPSPTPTTLPLSVVSEDPLNLDDLGVWAFPNKIPFSSSQQASVDELMRQALTNIYLIPHLANYFYALGGYATNADTQLVLQNDSDRPVSILDMRVIKTCGPPLSGTLFYAAGQAGDYDVGIGFNLDSTDTDAEFAQGWDTATWQPDYFESKIISFAPGEQRVLNIKAVTNEHSCIFSYQATVLDGKTKFYQTINDDGAPFRLNAITETRSSAPFSSYAAMYIGGPFTMGHYHGDYIKVDPKTYNGAGR